MTEENLDICLTREPLDVAAAVARVTCPRAGGIATFLGTTRAEQAVRASNPASTAPRGMARNRDPTRRSVWDMVLLRDEGTW